MNSRKTILIVLFFLLAFAAVYGERSGQPLDYGSALVEYYAGYCSEINEKQIQESYILRYPNEYVANDKDEAKKQTDLAKVKASVEKSIVEVNRRNHEYYIMLQGQLGEYDKNRAGFPCVFVSSLSCIDIGPFAKIDKPTPEQAEEQSVIARGVLFNKVNKIKLFFSNPKDFNFLPYPPDKTQLLLRNGANPGGPREIAIILNVKILPGKIKENRWKLDKILNAITVRTEESNYFMIAKIKNIEVYGDYALVNKLGDVVYNGVELRS